MRVLFANTRDTVGGAAIAAYRLFKAIQAHGINSEMLVDLKSSADDTVKTNDSLIAPLRQKIRSRLDYLPQKLMNTNNNLSRSLSFIPGPNLSIINKINPDIVHLHWIHNGFMSLEQMCKINPPIVWTLHDMWAFAGAEHYVQNDDLYIHGYEQSNNILDKWVWQRKKKVYDKLNHITFVTPSKWLSDCAKNSLLLSNKRIEVIANGINTDIFKPKSKDLLRGKYQLPKDKNIILFSGYKGVEDPRKGFGHLVQAIRELDKFGRTNNIELLVIGSEKSTSLNELRLKTNFMGMINDENVMSELYSLSDVFVLPSKQDNLPNTVLESMSCGTPVVAFNIGGLSDMIKHEVSGYLVEPFNELDLAKGIGWCLNSKNRLNTLSDNARLAVKENFDVSRQAQKYVDLYKELNTAVN